MRRFLWLSLAIAIAPTSAHADLLGRAVHAVGDEAGGGPPTRDDLASWAGATRSTTLAELLQVTVRQAPSLANARYDIAIAEAQISETWARRDWSLKAQVTGTRGYGGV